MRVQRRRSGPSSASAAWSKRERPAGAVRAKVESGSGSQPGGASPARRSRGWSAEGSVAGESPVDLAAPYDVVAGEAEEPGTHHARPTAVSGSSPRSRKSQYLEKMRELKRKKPSKGSLKRQKIIYAAAKVFSERGYNATKLADIAREAGTFPGSLYYHFASRDDITREVIVASMEVIAKQVQDALGALAPDASFADQLRCGIGAHLHAILSDAPWMGAYNRIINEIPPGLREEQKHLAHQYAMMWHRLITKAQARGELRRQIDPVLFRLFLFGSVTWSQLWFKPSGRLAPEDLADNIAEIFLWGSLAFDSEQA